MPAGSSFDPTLYQTLNADDRRLVILVDDHGQAVVELEALVGKLDLADQARERRGLGRSRRGNRLGSGRRQHFRGARRGGAGGQQGRARKQDGETILVIHETLGSPRDFADLL